MDTAFTEGGTVHFFVIVEKDFKMLMDQQDESEMQKQSGSWKLRDPVSIANGEHKWETETPHFRV